MAKSKKSIIGNSYVAPYAGNYFDLRWYERDFCGYFDHLRYQEMIKNRTYYFSRKKVVNFDIINHECRGDELDSSYKKYKAITKDGFKNFPENEKKDTIVGIVRNIKRDDLWLKRDLMIEYFKKNF